MDQRLQSLRANIQSVIKGKDASIDLLIASLLSGGHVLIEDLPGVGKTTLAKSLASSISGQIRRVQFTPDLLPTDILGGSVYDPRDGSFTFRPGPIFTNILLADEINRASPRTQSSLLEAMAEKQATIEGDRHPLPDVFLVIATENPIEFHGTYPLPEAQLDRFLVRMELGYVDAQEEVDILFSQNLAHPVDALKPVITTQEVQDLQHAIHQIHVAKELGRYIVDLVRATRVHPQLQMGSSPRGALGLFRIAQARAFMAGRDHIWPEDIQQSAVPVLAHRIMLETKAKFAGVSKAAIVQEVLSSVKVPK
jgi:MoxR-like ATPase